MNQKNLQNTIKQMLLLLLRLPGLVHILDLPVSVHPVEGLLTHRGVDSLQLRYLPGITKLLAVSSPVGVAGI